MAEMFVCRSWLLLFERFFFSLGVKGSEHSNIRFELKIQ